MIARGHSSVIARSGRDAGTKFDQRTFHDVILAIGSVPLPALEERKKQFTAEGGKNPSVTTPER